MEENTLPVFDRARCGTCREIVPDNELMKQPLGDQKLGRLSVFCGRCQRFLFVYDPRAQKELKDMHENRKRIEEGNGKQRSGQ